MGPPAPPHLQDGSTPGAAGMYGEVYFDASGNLRSSLDDLLYPMPKELTDGGYGPRLSQEPTFSTPAQPKTVMVSVLGARGAAVVGGLVDFGYIADSVGNQGIYIKLGVGTGVEVGVENVFLDLIESGQDILEPRVADGTVYDQRGLNPAEAHAGFFIGVQQDLDTLETKLDVGTVGGGVYKPATLVIPLP